MTDSIPADATGRITALVEGILAQKGADRRVEPDTFLTEAGLTSLDLVNLMLAIEAEFDLTIPSSHLGPQSFRSVATIARMVAEVAPPGRLVA
ncbi:phosphopantetheine-binding protein [Methylobacterium oryzihabitans]|uniref:Acyl carrier protein n=1 Tax=Methylobacterium oryzihabitans TaxID=2499852 RepID=A0A3S2YNS2_9HYPH|nr:phosphopantetheine-binding protein [Methylobacterium oryzihabitans]RVU15431.1 acyl carrier protein [Methylobacterium oryzihabitans]